MIGNQCISERVMVSEKVIDDSEEYRDVNLLWLRLQSVCHVACVNISPRFLPEEEIRD
jgi:hypothetical protein